MKYDEEKVREIVSYVEAGSFDHVAARAAGIATSTFYAWKKEKPEFSEALKAATAKAEARNAARINEAAKKQWQAAAWYLERKHNDRWGLQQKLKLTGHVGGGLDLSAEEKRSIAKIAIEAAKRKIKQPGDSREPGE